MFQTLAIILNEIFRVFSSLIISIIRQAQRFWSESNVLVANTVTGGHIQYMGANTVPRQDH